MSSVALNESWSPSWVWSSRDRWAWWEVVQLLLAVVGLAGNLLVMLVLFRARRNNRCSTDSLTAALALADFLTSFFIIPHREAVELPDTLGAHLYCRIIHSSILMWISICASIFTLTTLSIEKLVAVQCPYKLHRFFSPRRTLTYIVCAWLAAAVVNMYSPFIAYLEVTKSACAVTFPSRAIQVLIGTFVFLVEYLIPAIIMAVGHVFIFRALDIIHKRESVFVLAVPPGISSSVSRTELRRLRSRGKIIKMFFFVVVLFVLCWAPDQILFLAFNFGLINHSYLYGMTYRVFVLAAFVNSCANPIIYATRNAKFRRALRKVFSKKTSTGTIFDSVRNPHPEDGGDK